MTIDGDTWTDAADNVEAKIIARQVLFLRKETGRQSATGGPSATYSSFG
jgi:hypothetical protein